MENSTFEPIKHPYLTVRNVFGTFTFLKNEEMIGSCLKSGKPWEEKIITFCFGLCSDMSGVMVDGGSHIGCFTIPMSKLFPSVHCFDMQKEMLDLLETNLEDNNINNVKVYNCALGPTFGTVTVNGKVCDGFSTGSELIYSTENPVNYGGISIGPGGMRVFMVPLDSLKLEVSFIKFDLEGSESLAFYGARETIARCRPIILYERTWKSVTEEMKSAIDSDRVELMHLAYQFDIEQYVKLLDYYDPIPVTGGDKILLPRHTSNLLKERYNDQEGREIVFNKFTVKEGTEEYKYYLYTPKKMRIFILNYDWWLDAVVGDGFITLSNSSVWTAC
jgi:FkbM family methyltransferase